MKVKRRAAVLRVIVEWPPGFLWNVTIRNTLLKSRDFIAFEPDLRYTIYGLLCLPGEVKNLGQCADIEIMKKLAGGECHDEHNCG